MSLRSFLRIGAFYQAQEKYISDDVEMIDMVDNTDPTNPFMVGGLGGSYDVYTAFLSQSGTNAPTATILGDNNLGDIVFTRTGLGTYNGQLTGAFTVGKTAFVSSNYVFLNYISMGTVDVNNISISTFTLNFAEEEIAIPADNVLSNFFLEIRVYT